MASDRNYPLTLQSKLLGELVFDEDICGYVLAGRDLYSHIAGKPSLIAKPSEDEPFIAANFLAELDRTWDSLFARLQIILIDAAFLFAQEIESYEVEPAKAKEIAATITDPSRLRLVILRRTDDLDENSHDLVFVCKDFYSELAGQDAIVSLSESFEVQTVRFDG